MQYEVADLCSEALVIEKGSIVNWCMGLSGLKFSKDNTWLLNEQIKFFWKEIQCQ